MEIKIKAKNTSDKHAKTYTVNADVFGPIAVHADLFGQAGA